MANKKIKSKDIIEDGLFDNAKKSAEGLTDVLDQIEKGFKGIIEKNTEFLKTTKKTEVTVDTFEDLSDAVNDSQKAIEGLTAAQKIKEKFDANEIKNLQQAERLRKTLLQSDQQIERNKQQAIKTQQQELRLSVQQKKESERLEKQREREEKNLKQLNSEYSIQSKRLNELRKEYKDLALSTEDTAKEQKELLKEITQLDKKLKDVDAQTGQFQRSVGNYEKVNSRAKKSFGSLSGFLLGIFVGAFTKSRAASREFQGGIERLGNVVKTFAIAIKNTFVNTIVPNLQIFVKEANIAALEVKALFVNPFGGEKDKLTKRINALKEEINSLTGKGIPTLTSQFKGLGEVISETDANIVKRLELQDRLIDRSAKLSLEIGKLRNEEAALQEDIGNSTFSFQQRAKQIDELIGVQGRLISKEIELAKAQQESARLDVRNDLLRERAGSVSDQQLNTLSFLDDKNKADAIGLENLEKLRAANEALIAIEGQAIIQQKQANKERLENSRDLFEQELDFTLDIGDRQKAVNERILTDQRLLLADRKKILKQTEALLDDSFDEQIKLTEAFIRESLQINNGATEEESLKAVLDLNLEKLVLLEDEKQIREELFSAGISDEITQNRIREIIIERKAALQDVADIQRDLNEAQLESQQNEEDSLQNIQQENFTFQVEQLEKQLELQEQTNEKRKEIISDSIGIQKDALIDQANFEKELAEQEVVEAEELAAKKLEIENKLRNDIARLDREEAERKAELDRLELQDRKEAIQELTNLTISETRAEIDKVFDLRRQLNDKEITARQREIERQQDLAINGLENQLAFENKKLAEAEIEKREILEREARAKEAIKLSEIFLQAYLAELNQEGGNPAQAGAKAFAQTLIAKGISKTIAGSFIEGTENVAESLGDSKVHNGVDGYHIAVDGRERILSPNQNALIGNITNDDLAKLAYSYRTGDLTEPQTTIVYNENQITKEDIQQLIKATKESKTEVDLDNLGNLFTSTYKNGMKTVVKYKTRPRL